MPTNLHDHLTCLGYLQPDGLVDSGPSVISSADLLHLSDEKEGF